MKTKFLLQTLCITLLVCFLASAQKTESQNILNTPTIPNKGKSFVIPFTPRNDQSWRYIHYGLSLELGSNNMTLLPFSVNMRSSGIWVNNLTRGGGVDFHCQRSQTCKSQGFKTQYTWSEDGDSQTTLSGVLVKEKVKLGSVTLQDADILITNDFSNMYLYQETKGALGLNFRRSDPKIPTFFEYLKTEGFVDKSIFSIYLDKSNNGEFFFGGYDTKRAESEFQYAKWEEDKDPELPGFSLQAKSVGYGNTISTRGFPVVIDFEHPRIVIPEWIIDRMEQEVEDRGLDRPGKTCAPLQFLQDIVIELEGLTLRIPPAAYTKYGHVVYLKETVNGTKEEIGCLRYLAPFEEGSKPRIILGRPFLKFFYTVFNHEEKTVGFSQMTSLMKEYPFSEPVGDYLAMKYYLPFKAAAILAVVLLITKFFVTLYFIIRAWKSPGAFKKLVSSKIDIGIPVYSRVYSGNKEDNHQPDSQNIDVGKITIEEEKL